MNEPNEHSNEDRADRAESLLLEFLAERDTDCQACGYNLRDITHAVCPECGMRLELRVGLPDLRLGWLLAAVAPGLASGMLAVLLLILMLLRPGAPWGVMVINVLWFAGGAVSVALLVHRWRFMRARHETQAVITGAIWLVHLAIYAWLLLRMFI